MIIKIMMSICLAVQTLHMARRMDDKWSGTIFLLVPVPYLTMVVSSVAFSFLFFSFLFTTYLLTNNNSQGY
jgi:hypothetical protein